MIIAVIQARMGSTRLPGKVLLPLLGRPMQDVKIERVQRDKLVDAVVIATSGHPSDQPIHAFAQENDILHVRGAVDDVLDRYYQAGKRLEAEHIVRLTGDCPLSDPNIIDAVIRAHVKEGNDYTSNTQPPTFPDGYDVEVMTFKALQEAWMNANRQSEREHVTSYFRRDLPHVQQGNVTHMRDLSHLRLTVDEAADYEVIKAVYQGLIAETFSVDDVAAFLENHPDIRAQNKHLERNSSFKESLKKEAASAA